MPITRLIKSPQSRVRMAGLFIIFSILIVTWETVLAQPLLDDLFQPAHTEMDRLNHGQRLILTRIHERGSTLSTRLVHIPDPTRIQYRSSIVLDIAERGRYAASRRNVLKGSITDFSWAGDIDNGGHVFITISGTDVTGVVHVPGTSFSIEPLGGGLHVIVEMDREEIPQCPIDGEVSNGASNYDPVPGKVIQSRSNGGIPEFSAASSSHPVIDVLVVYTPAAASSSANINNVVDGSVNQTNQALQNSNISAEIRLAHSAEISCYTEPGSHEQTINLLQDPPTNHCFEAVHDWREQYGADLVILLSEENDSAGNIGWAYDIGQGADKAFATVEWTYATSFHVFAHEVGHLVGGRHHDDFTWHPEFYGRGYYHETGNPQTEWATILATGSFATPILHYSNPSVSYGGSPTGVAFENDVANVWHSRAAEVAAFRSPPTPLSANLGGDVYLVSGQTGNWLVDVSGGYGSTYNYKWYTRPSLGSWSLVRDVTISSNTDGYSTIAGMDDFEIKVDVARGIENATGGPLYVEVCYSPPGSPPCPFQFLSQDFIVVGEDIRPAVPEAFLLDQNYPNPFNPVTHIGFALPQASDVTLVVYDVQGREVARIVEGYFEAGYHHAAFDAAELPSGVYIYRIQASGFAQVKHMIVLK